MLSTITKAICGCALAAILMPVAGWAQDRDNAAGGAAVTPTGSRAEAWSVQNLPGSSTRYEFEGIVRTSTDLGRNVTSQADGDCAYRFRAVLKIEFSNQTADSSIGGQASFDGLDANLPKCAGSRGDQVNKALQSFVATGAEFKVYPGGDVRFTRPIASDEPETVSLLRKAAWDLLQPRMIDGPSASSAWTKTREFLYWPDTFVEEMDVAASAMHYARDTTVGSRNCALLEYRQVFSPLDIPAYTESRSRANDFEGTTFVTGRGRVSLLWDKADKRIVYLHRQRAIDNRLMLKYDDTNESRPLATFAIEEESTLRWLPEQNAETWLADLHKFESSAGEPDRKAASRPRHTSEQTDMSDLLDRVPEGFERWTRQFCVGPYCFDLSMAVPKGSRAIDESGATVLLASGNDARAVMVAIGPVLDLQSSGLSSDELLRQQTLRFVNNKLWFGRGTGEVVSFSTDTVHDRPAGASEFKSTSRSLAAIRGRLVMVVGPYQRLVPVACAHEEAASDLDAVCATVTASLTLR
jgi:hypothetical protein